MGYYLPTRDIYQEPLRETENMLGGSTNRSNGFMVHTELENHGVPLR